MPCPLSGGGRGRCQVSEKNRSASGRNLLNHLMNPKYIMVYATVGIFILIYLFGAIAYGDKGFTSLRTFVNMFIDKQEFCIHHQQPSGRGDRP